MRNALAILLATTLVTACGQRGPLYLPGEEREEVSPVAPAATPVAMPAAAPVASPIAVPLASPNPVPATDPEGENNRRNRAN